MNPMKEQRTASQKVGTAIAALLLTKKGPTEASFYGWMAAQLQRRVDNSIGTMALAYDYNSMEPELVINEDFVDSLTMAELKAVIIHEVLHLAHRHPNRRGSRDPERFNIGADMAVNHVIEKECGYNHASSVALPDGCVKPIENADKTTAEYFYDQLNPPNEKQKKWTYTSKPGRWGSGGGTTEEVQGDPGGTHDKWATFEDLPPENFDAQVLGMIKEASTAAGSTPASVQGAIAGLLKPKISWKHMLRTFVGTNTKVGTIHTWSRPSRRIQPQLLNKAVLGLKEGEELSPEDLAASEKIICPIAQGRRWIRSGTLGVVMDTSGSVPDNMLKQFMTEINTISKSHAVWIAECDAQVHDMYLFDPREYKRKGKRITGRGGTDMNPGLEAMNKHKDIEMIVILTDGYLFGSPTPKQKPELWCITPDGSTSCIEDRRHVVMKDN